MNTIFLHLSILLGFATVLRSYKFQDLAIEANNSKALFEQIKNYYGMNVTITFVFDDSFDYAFEGTSPRIVANLDKVVHAQKDFFNNYVIFSSNHSNLEELMTRFVTSKLWNPLFSPLGKYFIILKRYEPYGIADDIFSKLLKWDIVDSTVAMITPANLLIHKKNDFTNGKLKSKRNFVIAYVEQGTFAPLISNSPNKLGLIDRIAEAIGKSLDLNVSIIPIDLKREFILNGTVKNQEKVFDDGIADAVPIAVRLPPFYTHFSTTEVFFVDEASWSMAKPPRRSNLEILGSIFSRELWIPFLCTNVIIVISWYIIMKIMTGKDTSLDVFGLLLGLGLNVIPPQNTLKALAILFMFYSLQFTSLYQASLSSALTEPHFERGFKNLEEVLESTYAKPLINLQIKQMSLLSGTPLGKTLAEKGLPLTRHMGAKENLDFIVNNTNIATTSYSSFLVMYPNYRDKIKNIGNIFLSNLEMYLTMRKGHYLLKKVNDVLVRTVEAGLNIQWLEKMRGIDFASTDKYNVVLSIGHIEGALIILSIGYFIGFTCLLLEILSGKTMDMCFVRRT